MSKRDLYAKLKNREAELCRERERMIPHWRELRDYINPLRSMLGDRRSRNHNVDMRKVITGSALSAAGILASGLQSGLTSPSRTWFRLTVSDEDRNTYDVKSWLDLVQNTMLRVMATSNYYEELHNAYEELATFGNAAMFIDNSKDGIIHAKTFTVGTYACDVDSEDRLSVFFQRRVLSCQSVYEKFEEDDLPSDVIKAYDNEDFDRDFVVYHTVVKDSSSGRFKSYWYMDEDGGTIIKESYFYEIPVCFVRWDTLPDTVYGYGCGTRALGDVRQLMRMERDLILSIGKQIDPPLLVHNSLLGQPIVTTPSAITYTQSEGVEIDKFVAPLYQGALNLGELRLSIINKINDIRALFYVDLFMMISDAQGNMTATEVLERRQEKMAVLGSVLERLENELLAPSIKRIFGILLRSGQIPEPPEELRGVDLKIEYLSVLAAAQRSSEIPSLSQFTGYLANLVASFPDVADNIDPDALLMAYHELTGAPTKILRTAEEVEALREQRRIAIEEAETAQAQQAALNQGVQVAQGAEILSRSGEIGNQVLENTLSSAGLL